MKTPDLEDQESQYGIPSLDELGLDNTPLEEEAFPGGEQEALRRLEEHMKRTVIQLHIFLPCTRHIVDVS